MARNDEFMNQYWLSWFAVDVIVVVTGIGAFRTWRGESSPTVPRGLGASWSQSKSRRRIAASSMLSPVFFASFALLDVSRHETRFTKSGTLKVLFHVLFYLGIVGCGITLVGTLSIYLLSMPEFLIPPQFRDDRH
jgi:hypothetical protein